MKNPLKNEGTKILLLTPPYDPQERGGVLAPLAADLPSLGLLFLAAAARESGHRAVICDASAQRLSPEEVMGAAHRHRPEVVGISATTPSISRAGSLAGRIKQEMPEAAVLLGGPHATAVPEKTLERYPAFDGMVVGEGERTLQEVADRWPDRSWREVPGLVLRDLDGRDVRNEPRALLKDIDLLPWPAWDLLSGFPQAFRPAFFKSRSWPAAHFVTSRGCPHRCIFCDTSVFSRSIRYHGAEYVLEVLGELYDRYGVREVSFEDDMFMGNRKRLEAICEGIMRKGLRLTWTCNARVNSVSREILELFRKAGCWQIAYGIESGCQQILDLAKKGTAVEQVREALELTRQAGIKTRGFFIYGFPLETEQTMRLTLDFAKSLPLDDASLMLMTPFPGSAMHEIATQYGELDDDWDRMNLLNTVFVPRGLSAEILQQWRHRFIREFYLQPRVLLSYLGQGLASPRAGLRLARSAAGFFLRHGNGHEKPG